MLEIYQQLELEFGAWIGNENTVAVSSGTSALHLALEALALPVGTKVAVPEFTMVACARAVTMAGLEPAFVDCTEDLLIDCTKIPDDVKVIMPVHIYGRRCDMDVIHSIAGFMGMHVIEDMAEIHGVDPHPNSTAACWSFYKNKIIHGEEGGMISFKHKCHAELARLLRSQGFTPDHNFIHLPRGVNARLSNVHAKLILNNLHEFKEELNKRSELECKFNALIPTEFQMPPRNSPWVYDIQMSGYNIDEIVYKLKNAGIQARHSFKPMSLQPEYLRGSEVYDTVAYRRSKEVFYIPFDESILAKNILQYLQ